MEKNFLRYVKFSISQIIKDYLKQNNITQSYVAGEVGKTRQALNDKLKKKDIDVGLLYQISKAVHHDFFADVSKHWREEMKENLSSDEMTISRKQLAKEIEDYLKSKYPDIK